MADATSDTFAALKALFDADTGSGGLRQTGGGTAFCHDFLDHEDDPADTPGTPYIVCRILGGNRDAYGHESVRMTVRLSVVTTRKEQPSVSQGPVLDRIRTVFNNVVPSTTGGWTFRRLKPMRQPFAGPSTVDYRHRIVEFFLSASR
jgi:hypothetical protein